MALTDIGTSACPVMNYARRCNQLIRAAKRQIATKTGQAVALVQITPAGLVDFVISKKRGYSHRSSL
jgi:hypothetical protein